MCSGNYIPPLLHFGNQNGSHKPFFFFEITIPPESAGASA
jgi:hypothetical protein